MPSKVQAKHMLHISIFVYLILQLSLPRIHQEIFDTKLPLQNNLSLKAD